MPPVGVAHPGGSQYPVEATKDGKVKDKKGMGMGTVAAAGAGGLLAGGLIGHAMGDDSDDGKFVNLRLIRSDIAAEKHHAAPYGAPGGGYSSGYGAPPGAGYGAPGGYQDPYAQNPQALEHNPNVDDSDRESLMEVSQVFRHRAFSRGHCPLTPGGFGDFTPKK